MAHELEHKALDHYLDAQNLKHTKQRDVILDVFLEATGHITGEELYHRVRAKHKSIGQTTVYRTMKLLCDAGLATEHSFDDGVMRYEIKHEHHDHLVCVRCGKIIEFQCEKIEEAQNAVAQEYRFLILRHRHELYGHCENCRER